jgi:hypothetical protein
MGLGSVAKKATGTVKKAAKKASPDAMKKKMLGELQKKLGDPLGLQDKLGGLFQKLGIDPAQLNPQSIIRNIR